MGRVTFSLAGWVGRVLLRRNPAKVGVGLSACAVVDEMGLLQVTLGRSLLVLFKPARRVAGRGRYSPSPVCFLTEGRRRGLR